MSDGRKNNGGNKNAGRKPKAEEHKLIEKLTPLAVDGYKALESALKDKQGWAVKLFFEYMYGKPKQTIDQTSTINLNDFDISKLYDKQTEEDME
jgi:hypothetical protein|tara:strand:- start:2156 stop:2437 length:282 start_codon:yes stop_codon:yes gene_type:complete